MHIKINLRIFAFIIIFYFSNQIKIYGIFMLFVCIHELGHLLFGIALGFKPSRISINPLGLSISFEINTSDYNNKIRNGTILSLKKIVIALGGPLINIIIVILYCFFDIKFLNIEREVGIYTNLTIALFNLIPIYPLDGGRILKNIVHIVTGMESSYRYIQSISYISAIILTIAR